MMLCSDRTHGIYTSDIGGGREFYIVHETVRRQ